MSRIVVVLTLFLRPIFGLLASINRDHYDTYRFPLNKKGAYMFSNVSFNSQGKVIAGRLYQQKNQIHPLPIIILCHGFCGVKELLLPAFAEKFAANGYAVLSFDYRGFGQSEGEAGRLIPALQIEDIEAAVEWTSTQSTIDSSRVGLWGSSFGGANAIIAASQNEQVKCVVSQLTFADGETVITGEMNEEQKTKFVGTLNRMRDKKAKLGKEMMVPIAKVLSDPQSVDFFNAFKNDFSALNIKIPFLTVWETMQHKPINALPDLNVPLLIVAAEQDGVNPVSESERLFAVANEPKQLHIEQGATHYQVYEGQHFESVAKVQLNWFNKYL